MTGKNVTIRLDTRAVDRLQGMALVMNTTISDVIREAVDRHLAHISERDDFPELVADARQRHQEIFDLLVAAAEPSPNGQGKEPSA